MKRVIVVLCGIISTFASTPTSNACTTFSLTHQNSAILAKSYDWHSETGYLLVNKRGMQKNSIALLNGDRSFQWISKYGNVTFNQYGRELPNAGINEQGLAVEVMILSNSEYPQPSSVSSINESQWVQYMLDMAATTAEAKQLARQIRISKVAFPMHYQICDRSGDCAAFEYIDGDLRIWHSDADFPYHVLTNDTYQDSIEYLSGFQGFGGNASIPSGAGSLARFVRAADHLKNFAQSQTDLVAYAFSGIAKVASSGTQWQIVYDLDNNKIHYKTRTAAQRKDVDVTAFDFSCGTSVKQLNLVRQGQGDVTAQFVDYSSQDNEAQIRRELAGGIVPAAVVQKAIQYPSTTRCVEP